MITSPSFPTLAGQGWTVRKTPTFSTIVSTHVSGREVRNANYQNPIWRFELTFDGLTSASAGAFASGLGANSLQSLMGLFLSCRGQYGTFLYTDPTDNSVTAQAFASGDGTTTAFTFGRTLGCNLEPVGWVTNVSAVYLNAVTQGSGWSLTTPNTLNFLSAPGAGVVVSADFAYAFECRFDDDASDFEQFMANLWRAQAIKFRSVRTT